MYMANLKQTTSHTNPNNVASDRISSQAANRMTLDLKKFHHRNVCNAAVLFKFLACATVFCLQ